MDKQLKILLLEDNKADAEMIQRLLAKEKMNCEFHVVMNKPNFIKALNNFSPDIILSDHALPQFNSSKALEITRQKDPELPFILVTGAASEEFAANIIKQGADDYILKDRIARLPAAIKTAIKQRRTEKEHREILELIKDNEEKYRTLVERVSDGFIAFDLNWNFIFLNKKAEELYNRPPEFLIGKNIWKEFPESIDKTFYKAYHKAAKSQQHTHVKAYSFAVNKWIEANIYPSATGFSIFFRDISEQIEAENEAKESEEKYRTIFLKSPLPIWIFDQKTLQFLEVNNAAISHYGYSKEEFLSRTLTDIRPAEDVAALLKDVGKIKNSSDTRQGVWRHLKKNGEIIIVESTAHQIDYNNMKARMVIINDITEKIKAEKELKRRERRLNEAQALAHIGNWEIDLVQNTHFWSDELYKIFGLKKNGTPPSIDLFVSFFHPDDKEIAQKVINSSLKSFEESKISFQFIRKDGKQRVAHFEWKFEFDINKTAMRFYGILQDITVAKQAEENLKMMEQKIHTQMIQEQKKIARAIITGQEKERNYIAYELHDNINQILAGSKMFLSVAGKKSKVLKELITYPMELIDMSIDEIRMLSQKLVTPARNINLEIMIDGLLFDFKRNKVLETKLIYDVPDEILSDELKLNMYRIIQEQTNNIQKYAAAKNVGITVKTEDKAVRLIIEDDGIGFNVKTKSKGIGISNMINRAESFNGSVNIESAPGKGCKISVFIPC